MPHTRQSRPGNPRLAARWLAFDRTGSSRRRDELVAALLPLVRTVVAQACSNGAPGCADTLEAAGHRSLIDAVETFEPGAGASLEQHAWTAVVAAVRARMPQPPLAYPLTA